MLPLKPVTSKQSTVYWMHLKYVLLMGYTRFIKLRSPYIISNEVKEVKGWVREISQHQRPRD